MKWKTVVVGCFVTTAIELVLQRLGKFISLLKKHHRTILWIFVVVYLFIKYVNGNLTLTEVMDNLVYNLLGGLLIPG